MEDEYLRERIDNKVAEVTLSDTSLCREQQLLKLLKKVQVRDTIALVLFRRRSVHTPFIPTETPTRNSACVRERLHKMR